MTELTSLTVQACIDGLRAGDFSSVELTRALLQRIDSLESEVHAFLTLTPDKALAAAKAADDLRTSQPEDLPPLTGLPLAVKDVLCLEGVRTTCGSKILKNFIPPFTATAVQRLLDAGVIPLGKTNTDEFAMGSSTENSAYESTHNPWDTTRVPGGSSGGSAAAVAARITPAAFGTDTGGSVRQPCSFCGTTGIKPTYGRTSRYGLIAYGSSLDTVGMIARNVADVATLFQYMAGFDPLDATSVQLPVPEYTLPETDSLKGLRIGVPEEYFIEGIQPEVEMRVRAAITQMEVQGATAVPIHLPHTEYALPVYYLIAPAEASANLARYDGIRFGPRLGEGEDLWHMFTETRGRLFGPEVKRRIMLGTYALSAGYYDAYYGKAQKVRTLIKRDFDLAFEDVDVIAAPIAPTTAFKFGQHTDDPLAMYLEDVFTLPANLAGVPGLAFPVGTDSDGMPVGMQLMGPHFREDLLFQVGHAYQLATQWHESWPDVKILN
ncbi:Asp-tRNA(Asn)/Glu-tRNA(Gln) amidotransferase subunit GatA [Chloroflexota bacterium]|nr:Asp-tRNA(Asn)/Glu-tRNA(Gln) amidotransferase subunit GatA [Chloroflexota bacterium]